MGSNDARRARSDPNRGLPGWNDRRAGWGCQMLELPHDFPARGTDRIGPETADRAIGCERCHGPGANHLAAVAAGFSDPAIVNPASASPRAVTVERCNDCHILDRSFRHRDPEKPGWVRSQGVGWTWSRCNTQSGGAFGCVTCHDPHKGARSTTTAQYEAKCLACHSAATAQPASGPGPAAHAQSEPRPRICSVNPAKGCIQCHMPGVRMDSAHRDLTDHYIRLPRRGRRSRVGQLRTACHDRDCSPTRSSAVVLDHGTRELLVAAKRAVGRGPGPCINYGRGPFASGPLKSLAAGPRRMRGGPCQES